MFREIPTYTFETDTWSTSTFDTQAELLDYLMPIFKEPGEYEFDESSLMFNDQARKFNKTRLYCISPERSKDFIEYWNDQKNKCRNGVLIKHKKKTWYFYNKAQEVRREETSLWNGPC
jgi:hypothetical protein